MTEEVVGVRLTGRRRRSTGHRNGDGETDGRILTGREAEGYLADGGGMIGACGRWRSVGRANQVDFRACSIPR